MGGRLYGGLVMLVGHLEKEQEGDLLRVGHVREAVVPQDVGEVPGFVDDLLGVVAHSSAFPSLVSTSPGDHWFEPLVAACHCLHGRSARTHPLQQHAGWFVVRVLWDQFSLEGLLEDALAKAGSTLDGCQWLGILNGFDGSRGGLNIGGNLLLLQNWTKWQRSIA